MKERPILFSGPMVRAILVGTKDVTRRIAKPHKTFGSPGEWLPRVAQMFAEAANPYGKRRDRLWLRETFALTLPNNPMHPKIYYRADCAEDSVTATKSKWTPSIFMRRPWSRITLEILSVRVEQLHEITEADAQREGVKPSDAGIVFQSKTKGFARRRDLENSHRGAFAILWDEINGERAPWVSNPWVWRVEFRRLEQPPAFSTDQKRKSPEKSRRS